MMINYQFQEATGKVRGRGIERLEDCIKLDMHSQMRI